MVVNAHVIPVFTIATFLRSQGGSDPKKNEKNFKIKIIKIKIKNKKSKNKSLQIRVGVGITIHVGRHSFFITSIP